MIAGQGLSVTEHRVPEGAIVVHPKFCESCGWIMFVENGQRYCFDCVPPPLEFIGFNLGPLIEKALNG